jgi:hypothetical protein
VAGSLSPTASPSFFRVFRAFRGLKVFPLSGFPLCFRFRGFNTFVFWLILRWLASVSFYGVKIAVSAAASNFEPALVAKTKTFVSTNKWLTPGVTIKVFAAKGCPLWPGGQSHFGQAQWADGRRLDGVAMSFLNHHHHPVRTWLDRFGQRNSQHLVGCHFTNCLNRNHETKITPAKVNWQ